VNYEFEGWYESRSGGVKFNPAAPLLTAKEIYAHWKPVEHTLTFNYNYPADDPNSQDEPDVVKIEGDCEKQYTPPATPEHPHYTFTGWYTTRKGEIPYTPPATVEETRTVYAHWAGKQYKVKFDAGADANPKEQTVTVTYPAQAAEPQYTPTKESYGFIGWFTGEEDETPFIEYTPKNEDGDIFYAHWRAGVAAIALNYNPVPSGKQVVRIESSYNETLSLTAANNPSRTHYTFAGWYDDPNSGTLLGDENGNVSISNYTGTPAVLYARWTGVTYTLNLNVNGGDALSPNTCAVVYPKDLDLRDIVPTRAGYDFAGWFNAANSGTKYTILNAYDGTPGELFAHWTLKQHEVKFYSNGNPSDNSYLPLKVDHGASMNLPALPKSAAQIATGWFTDRSSGIAVTSATKVSAGMNVYAHWLKSTDANITSNATGGAITYVGTNDGFNEVHTFTVSGNFKFTTSGSRQVRALIVGGGGGGGGSGYPKAGGGGGAGGLLDVTPTINGNIDYIVTVGTGGRGGNGDSESTNGKSSPSTDQGVTGNFSYFYEYTALGGGYGGPGQESRASDGNGGNGGSGGGGGAGHLGNGAAGSSTNSSQGHNGSISNNNNGGGGGGAGGAGGVTSTSIGGSGKTFNYIGSATTYAEGGHGGGYYGPRTTYGSGGSGGALNGSGYPGNSGIVIISFPYKYTGN
jgi:uncharacterized repeat protein (TIGR02543 family)